MEMKFWTILKDRLITSPNGLRIHFLSFPIFLTIWWFTVVTSGPADPSVFDNPAYLHIYVFKWLVSFIQSTAELTHYVKKTWTFFGLYHTAYTQKQPKCGCQPFPWKSIHTSIYLQPQLAFVLPLTPRITVTVKNPSIYNSNVRN